MSSLLTILNMQQKKLRNKQKYNKLKTFLLKIALTSIPRPSPMPFSTYGQITLANTFITARNNLRFLVK